MGQLNQVKIKEAKVIAHKNAIQAGWDQLKQESLDKLTSPQTLIWSGIIGFVSARVFKLSNTNLLFAFWPLFRKLSHTIFNQLFYSEQNQGKSS